MNPWWLLLIIPGAAALGAVAFAVYFAVKLSKIESR